MAEEADGSDMRQANALWIWEGRPAIILAVGISVLVSAALAAVIALLFVPASSVDVDRVGSNAFSVGDSGVYADGPVAILDDAGQARFTMPLSQLAGGYEPPGDGAAIDAFQARKDAIAAFLRQEGSRLRLPDGSTVAIEARGGGFNTVAPDIWIILASGLGAAMIGTWVLSLRPRSEAARALAYCGYAYFPVTFSVALFEMDSPAMTGAMFWAAFVLNTVGGMLIALELCWLFARYPEPLVPRRLLAFIYVAALLYTGASLFWWREDVYFRIAAVSSASVPLIISLWAAQLWRNRTDLRVRAAFSLIGSSLLLVLLVVAVAYFVPYLNGQPPLVPMAVYNALFLFFFLTLGVAVARYRLFDLGRWSLRIAGMAMVLAFILMVDAMLVLVFGQSWTLSIALFFAAMLWLPVRHWMMGKFERRVDRNGLDLLQRASLVAFAPGATEQRDAWTDLLVGQFAPLSRELVPGPSRPPDAALADEGRTLMIPSPLDDTVLALSYASHGKRLFNDDDVAMAQSMIRLVAEVVEARRAYDRGAEEERARIARDLHDDVGARLMTSLHRDQLPAIRADIGEAMADMRLIIDGLTGQSRYLADAIADLRHETVSRLRLARIEAEWRGSEEIDELIKIDQGATRILFSVVRELASNAIRHSGASRVTIDCHASADAVELSIGDDGVGIAGPMTLEAGNGLRNIRKRVVECGGTIDIGAPPTGTLITFHIPLASRERGMAGIAPQP